MKWEPMAKRKKRTIKDLQRAARKRGGKCLSLEYEGTAGRYAWECRYGHTWNASGNSVLNNETWCPTCRIQYGARSLRSLQTVAAERGGRCLSTEYKGAGSKYLWQCEQGHKWKAIASRVVRKTWCPVCYKLKTTHTIQNLHDAAAERGGKCLSSEYIGVAHKYTWECAEGHRWKSRASSVVKLGTWCPMCFKKRYERIPSEFCKYDNTERGVNEPCHTCSLSLPRKFRGDQCPLQHIGKNLEQIIEAEDKELAVQIAAETLKMIRPGTL